MDINRDRNEYLEEESFETDDGAGTTPIDSLSHDLNGIAWREIEKYHERKELENILKDDLYDDIDVNGVWE